MFQLELVTPDKKIVTGEEVEEVIVPGHRGELNILPGHSPLVSTLGVGVLRYKLKNATDYEKVVIGWGYCQVNPMGVSILAETAEALKEIDKVRAEKAKKEAEKMLLDPDLEADQIVKFQKKLRKAEARLQAARH